MVAKTMVSRSGGTMKTIDKAMKLLGYFLPDAPEWRLSDLARAAGMDKVTTMRVLNSLAASGLVEQHPETKKYRLGAAVLRLARIREACFPVAAVLQPILEKLTEATGETSHACLFSDTSMTTIAVAEPNRSTRAFVNPSQPLAVYATASGLAFLANCSDETIQKTLSQLSLHPLASNTPTSKKVLRERLRQVRDDGFVISARTFEDDITGIAAPIFDWHGTVRATIAVACVSSRLNEKMQEQILNAVLRASIEATHAMGGEVREDISRRLTESGA